MKSTEARHQVRATRSYDESRRNQEAQLGSLWAQYNQHSDTTTRESLLAKYSYLVNHILGKMKVSLVPYLDMDDLRSAGIISLIQAFDRFDPHRGIKFETYAYRRIQGGILDYLRQIDYLSRTSRERIRNLKRSHAVLSEKLGRTPSDSELMKEMKMNEDELKKAYFDMSCEAPCSLEAKNESSNDGEMAWKVEVDRDENETEALDKLVRNEAISQLAKIIEALPEREKTLVSLYYYEDLTFKEIGDLFHVSESRICQMHGKILLDIEAALRPLEEAA